jgi:hypothetical protein
MKTLIEFIQSLLFVSFFPEKYKKALHQWDKNQAVLRETVEEFCKTIGLSDMEIHEFLERDPAEVLDQFICDHPRAFKLLLRRENFIVIRDDEPYFKKVYSMIRDDQVQRKLRWDEIDEYDYMRFVHNNMADWYRNDVLKKSGDGVKDGK